MTDMPSIDDVRALERFIARDGSASLLLTFQGILRSHEEMRAALSTPPADDVREAVDHAVRVALSPLGIDYVPWWKVVHAVRDSLLAEPSIEVRPRGTVTDAEVEAGAWSLLDRGMDLADRSPSQQVFEEAKADARAVLEAAREARS